VHVLWVDIHQGVKSRGYSEVLIYYVERYVCQHMPGTMLGMRQIPSEMIDTRGEIM
jgi:hypothetical protein